MKSSSSIKLDGVVYKLTSEGAKRTTGPARSNPKAKRSEQIIVSAKETNLNFSTFAIVLTIVRMMLSLRFWLVVIIPVAALVVIKAVQLNSYELVHTFGQWFNTAKFARIQFAAAFAGLILVAGTFVETALRKQLADKKTSYWGLYTALIGSSAYFGLLVILICSFWLGVSTLLLTRLYAVFPVLALFLVFLLTAVLLAVIIWCWARRNYIVSRFTKSFTMQGELFVPHTQSAPILQTVSQGLGRALQSTLNFLMLALVAILCLLVFVSGLPLVWLLTTEVLGLSLALALLSYDHLRKIKYWQLQVPIPPGYKRYPARAMMILGIDSLILILLVFAVTVQLILPKLWYRAHNSSAQLKKAFDQLNLTLPSPKQVKPFDNSTQNR